MREEVRHAHINALLAALPDLNNSQPVHPRTTVNLGKGFVLLHKQDKNLVYPFHGTGGAVWEFLGCDGILKIKRWGRLKLPNGQISQSAWRETQKCGSEKLHISQMVKVWFLDIFLDDTNTHASFVVQVSQCHSFQRSCLLYTACCVRRRQRTPFCEYHTDSSLLHS